MKESPQQSEVSIPYPSAFDMSYRSIDALQLRLENKISEAKTALSQAIVDSELNDLRLNPEVRSKARSILKKIVADSYDRIYGTITEKQYNTAISDASVSGLRMADTLVAEILLGQQISARELLNQAGFPFLLETAHRSLQSFDIDWRTLNFRAIQDAVITAANEDSSPEKRAIVEQMVQNNAVLSPDKNTALQLVATGIHDSWAAIQLERTVRESHLQALDMIADKAQGTLTPQELIAKHGDLRIMRGVYRSFPEMQRSKFLDGSAAANNPTENGIALSMYEVLKDLVQIGLYTEAELNYSNEPYPEDLNETIRQNYEKVRQEITEIAPYMGNMSFATIVKSALNRSREINWENVVGLTDHLNEVARATDVVAEFLRPLTRKSRASRVSNGVEVGAPYLSQDQITMLVEVIAPSHDLLKLLGSPFEQNVSDHEVLIGRLFEETGHAMKYDEAERKFGSGVFKNHENIYKEQGRTNYSLSADPVERAVAIFGLIDSVGEALMNDHGQLAFNERNLELRFTDLVRRHIDRKIYKLEKPRPEWIISTVLDFRQTLKTLREEYGLVMDSRMPDQLVQATIKAIDQTLAAQASYKKTEQKPHQFSLTDAEILTQQETRHQLERIMSHEE